MYEDRERLVAVAGEAEWVAADRERGRVVLVAPAGWQSVGGGEEWTVEEILQREG